MNLKNTTTEESVQLQLMNLIQANHRLRSEINDRLRVEEEMQSTINRFQTIADRAPGYIALVDSQSLKYEFVNSVFADAYGLKREDVIGHHMKYIIGIDNFKFAKKFIAIVRFGKTAVYERYFTTTRKSGWLRVNYSPVFNALGQVEYFVVLSWDITAQKLQDEKIKSLLAEKENLLSEMEKLAITDSLTGALNRRHFYEVATREIARAKRTGNPLSITMFDLDHFKQINDNYGHHIGDEVLKSIVSKLFEVLRANDNLARIGGEEFLILLPDTNGKAAYKAAERFRAIIANIDSIRIDDSVLHFTASFGVTQIDVNNSDFESILQQVDKALYQAKAKGRNCVVRT